MSGLEHRLMINAALISAGHNLVDPVRYNLRGYREDVPAALWTFRTQAGPPFAPRGYAEVDVSDAAFWLGICSALTRPARDGKDTFLRKGWSHACRLTGLSWGLVKKAVYDARFYGAERAGAAWAIYMRQADPRCIGSIYVAHAIGEPEIAKVGFSTDLAKRQKALSREAGKQVVIERSTPGTLLHEWALHASIPGAVKSEWYPRENLPSWMLAEAA